MSHEVQRLIRKLQPKGPRSFDEEVWPIYVAIVVLFGYLVGIIVAVLRFNEARWYANALTWLIALSLTAGVGLFCVRFLEQRILKRTIVLSLLLSLIINVSLMIIMAWTYILNRSWEDPNKDRNVAEKRKDVIVPHFPPNDRGVCCHTTMHKPMLKQNSCLFWFCVLLFFCHCSTT